MFRETAFKTARNISINQRTNLAGPAHIIIREESCRGRYIIICFRNRCKEMASAICDIKWGKCRRKREREWGKGETGEERSHWLVSNAD